VILYNVVLTLKSTSGIDTFCSTRTEVPWSTASSIDMFCSTHTEVPWSAASSIAVVSLLLLHSRLRKVNCIVVHTESPVSIVLLLLLLLL
jgi:choline-glycine betaine transporter